MNLKKFIDGAVPEDWMITDNCPDVETLYEEVKFEMQQYADDTADDMVIIHDMTAYQILVILRTVMERKFADAYVLIDLQRLASQA